MTTKVVPRDVEQRAVPTMKDSIAPFCVLMLQPYYETKNLGHIP
jgi:hypothetical protein